MADMPPTAGFAGAPPGCCCFARASFRRLPGPPGGGGGGAGGPLCAVGGAGGAAVGDAGLGCDVLLAEVSGAEVVPANEYVYFRCCTQQAG